MSSGAAWLSVPGKPDGMAAARGLLGNIRHDFKAVFGKQRAIRLGSILGSAIGMVDAAFRWQAAPDGRLQGGNRNTRIHRSADGVANHLARPGIQDSGEIDEPARNGDVGQIGFVSFRANV